MARNIVREIRLSPEYIDESHALPEVYPVVALSFLILFIRI